MAALFENEIDEFRERQFHETFNAWQIMSTLVATQGSKSKFPGFEEYAQMLGVMEPEPKESPMETMQRIQREKEEALAKAARIVALDQKPNAGA